MLVQLKVPKLNFLKSDLHTQTMALIYQTNVRQKNVHTTISTQTSAFINLDISGSYDHISHQV